MLILLVFFRVSSRDVSVILSEMSTEPQTKIPFRILPNIPHKIPLGNLPAIPSGISAGITVENLERLLSSVLTGSPSGNTAGIPSGI